MEGGGTPQGRPMNRKVITAIVAAALIGAAILAYWLFWPEPVDVVPVTERDVVETLVATGQIQPHTRAEVAAQVPGRVVEVLFEEGDSVADGEVLARLDDQEVQAAHEQAAARVSAARARLRSVTEQGAPTAVQDLRKATVAYEGAIEELERGRQLFDAGVVTGARVDELERQVEQAEAEVKQAQARAEEASADGSAHDEATAGLRQALAEQKLARVRLEQHTLRAPRDGVVLSRHVEPGTTVQPGAPVAVVAFEGPVELRLDPDERELAILEPGQRAVVAVDAFDERPFEAIIDRVAPAVDPERGTIGVHLLVDDPPAFLRADMTASVEIIIDRRANTLVVPSSVLRETESNEPFVLVIEESRAQPREVSTGLAGAGLVEILDGLERSEEVIAEADVAPGDRVRKAASLDIEAFESDPGTPGGASYDTEVPQAL
jgi:HlyD family secretion protein